VRQHVRALRQLPQFEFSELLIFVERYAYVCASFGYVWLNPPTARNLGFEAEHMQRAMRGEPRTTFWRDEQAQRTGILTTDVVKHAAMTLTNVFLREHRICLFGVDTLVSRDPQEVRRRIREQLEIYSLQFKTGDTVFAKTKVALSGKVGGFKDDLVICLQLGLYWTENCRLSAMLSA
jgi:hypothetical protein